MNASKMMSQRLIAIVGAICLIAVTALIARAAPQSDSGDESALIGDWRGDSICQVPESACHDEKVVYHLSKSAGKSGWITVSADKIVNGSPVNMGSIEFKYDKDKKTLESETPQGVWKFAVAPDKMEGTLTSLDGTLFRRVSLTKVK
jgi:hypothetical protein